MIVTDNGPEFAGRALGRLGYQAVVKIHFILGKPGENAYVESFDGRFRDVCLNEHWFTDLADSAGQGQSLARGLQRGPPPNSSLGNATPKEYSTTPRLAA